MTFAGFVLVPYMPVTKLTISSYDRGNDSRLVDLYVNQCLDLYIKNAILAPLSSLYS
jgi:hypothetical protein